MRQNKTLKIAIIANFTALSTLLYFTLKFPLPFIFPAFLDIQFSNLPAIIGGFMFGPLTGAVIITLRALIKLPFSSTAMVGELADLIIGLGTVLVSAIIYQRMRSKKGAIIASIAGILTWVFVATAANYFFLLPFYVEFYFGGDVAPLLGMLQMIPDINADNYLWKFALYTAIPFNLLLASLVYLITFLVYKRIVHLFEIIDDKYFKHDDEEQEDVNITSKT